jgi:diguanylate cyclase (GGDEF)-like protein
MGRNYNEWGSTGRESFFKSKLSTLRNLQDLETITAKEAASTGILLQNSGITGEHDAERLELMTLIDEPSELYNLQHFQHILNYEISRGQRYRRYLSICIISIDDADGLKIQLKESGYKDILKLLAQSLKHTLRDVDFPARFSESSFAVILPETTSSGLTTAAERIRKNLKSAKLLFGATKESSVSVSLGCATFPTHGKTAEELVNRALKSLDIAQQRGGDMVCMI